MGSTCAVKLYRAIEGRKEFIGTLTGYSGGDVTVDVSGAEYTFKSGDVANVRLSII